MDDHPRCRGVGSARVLGAGGPTTVYRDNGVDGYRVYRRLEDVETHLTAEVTPGAGSSRKLLSSSAWISAALAMVVPKSSAKRKKSSKSTLPLGTMSYVASYPS